MTTLVFVHGWSVTSTSTYGQLPQQLQQQRRGGRHAADAGATSGCREYVSFDDAVTMADLVRAFDHALRDLHLLDASFACITHSTGGPVVREWLRAQRETPRQPQHDPAQPPGDAGAGQFRLGAGAARQGRAGAAEVVVRTGWNRASASSTGWSWAAPTRCRSTSTTSTAATRRRSGSSCSC